LKRIRQSSQKFVALAATFDLGPSVIKAHPIILHSKAQLVMIEHLKTNTNASASTTRKSVLEGVRDQLVDD
jgi:hypothetical protein